MGAKTDDAACQALCRVMDRDTTKSWKRTINTVAIIIATKHSGRHPAWPRRATLTAALLGIAWLLVREHVLPLQMLLYLIRV